jgi:mRNA-degrading endonuclease toxin of MazEF toxin-antitoxin module
LDQSPDAAEIPQVEPVVAGEQQGRKPELALQLFAFNMDVHRLAAVEAVEEQTEWTGHPLDRRHPEGYTTT